MGLTKPKSMEECIYFTNRVISSQAGSGKAIAWVLRVQCTQCNKGFIGKPLNKSGKFDKKADHYVCYSCGYEESNEQMENKLVLNIEYKCPFCSFEGETTSEYKRRKFEGIESYVFECQNCHKNIGITKKMKEKK